MNEEANFCSQCGATVSTGAKFCSNCGYDLQNSSNKTSLDANIKVKAANIKLETTNATLEKGIKATGATLGKGIKATGAASRKGLLFSIEIIEYFLKPLNKLTKPVAILLLVVCIISIGQYLYLELYLKQDRDNLLEHLKVFIEKGQTREFESLQWDVGWSEDPASRKNIVNEAYIKSEDSLCRMSVELRIDGTRLTDFRCSFEFLYGPRNIKFDNDHNLHFMNLLRYGSNKWHADRSAYVKPAIIRNPRGILTSDYLDKALDPYYVAPDPPLSYENFMDSLISSKTVAIQLIPTIDHEYYNFKYILGDSKVHNDDRLNLAPVWIRFPLKGAKEAIAKLGKELETAPNISND
jgi:hypothetical protein